MPNHNAPFALEAACGAIQGVAIAPLLCAWGRLLGSYSLDDAAIVAIAGSTAGAVVSALCCFAPALLGSFVIYLLPLGAASTLELRLRQVTVPFSEEQLEEIVVQNTLSGAESAFRTRGLFVAVGTVPQTELLAGQLALQEDYVIAGEDTRTSVRGVYAAGDIRTKPLRQVICAASDGAVAAALVQADLNSIEIG